MASYISDIKPSFLEFFKEVTKPDNMIGGLIFNRIMNAEKSEADSFTNFMNENVLNSAFEDSGKKPWNPSSDRLSLSLFLKKSNQTDNKELQDTARQLIKEYDALLNADLDFEAFKNQYMEFKGKHDEFFAMYQEEMAKSPKAEATATQDTQKISQKEEDKKEAFKPIQGESKNNETYKEDDIATLQTLQIRQKKNQVDILLNKEVSQKDSKDVEEIIASRFKNRNLNIKA